MADTSSQKSTKKPAFTWNKKREEAAMLLAEDNVSDERIAANAGVSRNTLATWKRHPDFAARVQDHVAALQERARTHSLARIDKRMAAYQDQYDRLMQVIVERGDDMADVPGGQSGFLVRQFKSIGTGPNARQVEEYPFDAALHRELRELLKQAAQDAGQWSDTDASVNVNVNVSVAVRTVAERLARERGQSVEDVLAEADRIIAETVPQ